MHKHLTPNQVVERRWIHSRHSKPCQESTSGNIIDTQDVLSTILVHCEKKGGIERLSFFYKNSDQDKFNDSQFSFSLCFYFVINLDWYNWSIYIQPIFTHDWPFYSHKRILKKISSYMYHIPIYIFFIL